MTRLREWLRGIVWVRHEHDREWHGGWPPIPGPWPDPPEPIVLVRDGRCDDTNVLPGAETITEPYGIEFRVYEDGLPAPPAFGARTYRDTGRRDARGRRIFA